MQIGSPDIVFKGGHLETIKTDVLVIGSEGAGARASIEAYDQGVDVTLVTKGRVGRHGATVMGAADIAVDSRSLLELTGKGNPEDNPRTFLEDMVIEGKWLNDQPLARLVTEEAPGCVHELLEWGLKFSEIRQMPGHRFPRSLYTSGLEMVRTLKKQISNRKIRVVEDVYIFDLLTRKGEAIGAIGLDLRRGEAIAFLAKAVILATGGCHNLYPYNTGSEGLTGDGHAMAYRAGAKLVNMEMTQFVPTTPIEPSMAKGSLFPFLLGPQNALRVWLLNKYGERFMSRWDSRRMEHSTRDLISIAIMTEVLEGRGSPGGGVYYSLAHLPRNLVENFAQWGARPFLKPDWHAHGLDFRPMVEDLIQGKAIEVVPAAHFFMGGVKINEHCETTVNGLFAAGELAGGIQGANRLSGTAFSQMIIFGKRAGHFAAQRAVSLSAYPSPTSKQLKSLEERLFRPLQTGGKFQPFEIKHALQEIAWKKVGVIREEATLENGIKDLEKIMVDELTSTASRSREKRYNPEWIECLQVDNMALVLTLIARSALLRQESRGAHFRKDFPDTDNRHWLQNTTIKRTDEGTIVDTEPVALTFIKPPN